jgi:hypothetical protein
MLKIIAPVIVLVSLLIDTSVALSKPLIIP